MSSHEKQVHVIESASRTFSLDVEALNKKNSVSLEVSCSKKRQQSERKRSYSVRYEQQGQKESANNVSEKHKSQILSVPLQCKY